MISLIVIKVSETMITISKIKNSFIVLAQFKAQQAFTYYKSNQNTSLKQYSTLQKYLDTLDMKADCLSNRQTWFLRYRKQSISQIPKKKGFIYCYQYQGETDKPIFKIGFTGQSIEERMRQWLQEDNRYPIIKFCIPSDDANLLEYYVHDYFFQYRFIREIFNQKRQQKKKRIQWFQFVQIPLEYIVMVTVLMNLFARNEEISPLVTVHKQVSIMFPGVPFKFPSIYLTEDRQIHYQIVATPLISEKQIQNDQNKQNKENAYESKIQQGNKQLVNQIETRDSTPNRNNEQFEISLEKKEDFVAQFRGQSQSTQCSAISVFQLSTQIDLALQYIGQKKLRQNMVQQVHNIKQEQGTKNLEKQCNNTIQDQLQQLRSLFDSLSFAQSKY